MGLVEKVKLEIAPTHFGEVPDVEGLREAMVDHGWSDDPGTGMAVLDEFGREILNPVPVAPPIGYQAEQSMMDRITEQLLARQRILAEDAIQESQEDAEDFDVGDDFDPMSRYEVVVMADDAPRLPPKTVEPPGEAAPEAVVEKGA